MAERAKVTRERGRCSLRRRIVYARLSGAGEDIAAQSGCQQRLPFVAQGACMCVRACVRGSLLWHLSLGGGAEQCSQLSIALFSGQIKRRRALLCVCMCARGRVCVCMIVFKKMV